MRKIILALVLSFAAIAGISQTASVKGRVVDTLERKDLRNAVVALLRPSDSLMIGFQRTDTKGSFHFDSLPAGKYILLLTYPKFADFSETYDLTDGTEKDLSVLPMTLKSQLLDAVIVKSAGAVRIKGDTTEFVADSFLVKEGATVEDLLKKLPGFQVNSKGEITTQGQKVQKVLVDGEEFFGDDPTMATQNISAKAVDKVQVFDSKTEQQNLKGITTGTEGKTVNIKLKEDAKKGAFGKGHVGTNFDGLVDAKLLYNKFKGNQKVSVYGTKSDVSTGSLNWEDRQKLGIEEDYEYDEISGFYYSFNSGDEFSNWSLRGLPHSYTAGALYSNKMRAERDKINLSYRYNWLATVNDGSTLTQNILSSGITYRNKFQHSNGFNEQHATTGKYEWQLDSLASIKITSSYKWKQTKLNSNVYAEFLDAERNYINQSDQFVDNTTLMGQSDNQIQYKQKFKKKDRLMIVALRLGTVRNDLDGTIISNTRFYKSGAIDSIELADQKRMVRGNSTTVGGKITWSEPLSPKWAVVAEYAYNVNKSNSSRDTYNKDAGGKYSISDPLYSNHFDLDISSQSGTGTFKYTGKKLKAAFGSGVTDTKMDLFNRDKNEKPQYNFLRLTPQGTVSWNYKAQSRVFFSYRGSTKQPTIDQLQPIRDNADRLNIFVGNPDLKVGFVHDLNIGYNTYKVLKQRGIFTNFHYSIPTNAVTFNNYLDVTKGTQVYTPVNVNGNRSWNGWLGMFNEAGDKKLGFSPNINASGGKNANFINGEKNITTYMNSDLYLNFRYNVTDKRSFEVSPRVGYNRTKSSLNPTFNNNYWNYGGNIDITLMLPWKLEFNTNAEFDLRQHLAAFPTNPNIILWNSTLSKKVFKNKAGKIIASANDILDQNKGVNRNITSNFVSQERFSKLSRYFLLKFEYTFNKMPGQGGK